MSEVCISVHHFVIFDATGSTEGCLAHMALSFCHVCDKRDIVYISRPLSP